MKNNPKTTRELQEEIDELHSRLAEAEEVVQAIDSGAVDAVVVSGPQGEQVFTLKGAEHAYRVLVEAMNEGAATLSRDGLILYANASLAKMLKKPLEKIIGTPMREYVAPEDASLFDALLLQGAQTSSKGELTLKAHDATRLPAFISISNPACGSDSVATPRALEWLRLSPRAKRGCHPPGSQGPGSSRRGGGHVLAPALSPGPGGGKSPGGNYPAERCPL